MVADATGRVILPVRVIYIRFFIVTIAPNKASSESNSNNLKKDDFPKTAPAVYPVFFRLLELLSEEALFGATVTIKNVCK